MALSLYNVRFILLISASFITIFSSIAIHFCLPILISHVIRNQLSLSPGSGSFNDWRLNSVIDRIYLYNITNFEELFSDKVKQQHHSSLPNSQRVTPKLQQIGPFTFRQDREKINIRFDSNNETVLYDQKKLWTFLPELSAVKSLEDLNSTWIYHINVPLAGTTLNAEYADFIEPIVSENDLKLFLKHSANTLLFEGYYDLLMEQAKSAGQIDVDRFGWMHNQNNSITSGIRIFTGPSNSTLDKLGSIDQYHNASHFDHWHNNGTESKDTSNVLCNEFRFSSAGEFFPPPKRSIISYHNQLYVDSDNHDDNQQLNTKQTVEKSQINDDGLTQKRPRTESKSLVKTISLFMPDLCRTFKLYFNGTYIYKDLSVDRYIANEFTYDYTNEPFTSKVESPSQSKGSENGDGGKSNPNLCYCIYNENTKLTSCPPNGMMDLFTCRKGSPLTISFPHFLYSNQDKSLTPYLSLFDENVAPSESEHQFFIDLESTLNIPVRAQIVIQFNVHFKNEPNLNFTHEYSFLVENQFTRAQQGSSSKPQASSIYLPQMWFKSSAEIDERNLNNLKFIQHHLKFVTPITTLIIFGFASILLIMSAKLAYNLTYGPKSRKSISRDQESCSSLNRNDTAFMDDKQKYYAMQLLDDGEKANSKSSINNKHNGNTHDDRLDKPTTSKVHDLSGESQPLNS